MLSKLLHWSSFRTEELETLESDRNKELLIFSRCVSRTEKSFEEISITKVLATMEFVGRDFFLFSNRTGALFERLRSLKTVEFQTQKVWLALHSLILHGMILFNRIYWNPHWIRSLIRVVIPILAWIDNLFDCTKTVAESLSESVLSLENFELESPFSPLN